jgi:hypothetical protein
MRRRYIEKDHALDNDGQAAAPPSHRRRFRPSFLGIILLVLVARLTQLPRVAHVASMR